MTKVLGAYAGNTSSGQGNIGYMGWRDLYKLWILMRVDDERKDGSI